ncbi:hypothetical protein GCM10018987_37280 [Streptomyces cremeus]
MPAGRVREVHLSHAARAEPGGDAVTRHRARVVVLQRAELPALCRALVHVWSPLLDVVPDVLRTMSR